MECEQINPTNVGIHLGINLSVIYSDYLDSVYNYYKKLICHINCYSCGWLDGEFGRDNLRKANLLNTRNTPGPCDSGAAPRTHWSAV